VTLVLDASAAVRATLHPEETAWKRQLDRADEVLAPELIVAELCNAFWKYVLAGASSREEAETYLQQALGLVNRTEPLAPMASEVLDLALHLKRPVYDLFYLALARRYNAVLLTADAKLRSAANSLGIATNAEPM
jgi:predicted nucleic acid-binding protein